MNSMSIKDKLRNVSKSKDVDFNTVLRLYMYDRFIERLSVSRYKDNFILKGGFYLSSLFGIENRSTMDIDTLFKNADFTEENIKRMLEEIVSIDIQDDAILKLNNVSNIREEDEYGGFRFEIIIVLDNMKEKINIDIAIGDPITPKAITYKYKPILGAEPLKLRAYNIETVLAEKLETILNRAEANSRTRDYYDIYLIYIKEWQNINKETFRNAVEKTFEKREYNGDIGKTFDLIKNSDILKRRWELYSRKYGYAKEIAYEDITNCLEEIIEIIEPIVV